MMYSYKNGRFFLNLSGIVNIFVLNTQVNYYMVFS